VGLIYRKAVAKLKNAIVLRFCEVEMTQANAKTLFEEYHDWFPGSKIELVDGQLIIGNSLTRSHRLLQQILRGWVWRQSSIGSRATLVEALSQTFGCPFIRQVFFWLKFLTKAGLNF
jgi:hypothetical protein